MKKHYGDTHGRTDPLLELLVAAKNIKPNCMGFLNFGIPKIFKDIKGDKL